MQLHMVRLFIGVSFCLDFGGPGFLFVSFPLLVNSFYVRKLNMNMFYCKDVARYVVLSIPPLYHNIVIQLICYISVALKLIYKSE